MYGSPASSRMEAWRCSRCGARSITEFVCYGSRCLSPAKKIDVDLRVEALKAFRIALFEARHATPRAKTALLDAQRSLVEAFLEDRRENARFFMWAHRIGAIREERRE